MDISEFKKTEYFKILSSQLDELENERIEFNTEIISLLNKEKDELGIVLKSHLIIEHYIDKYLMVAYPTITNWNGVRLSFHQKIEIIKDEKTSVFMFYSALKCINKIRNKFVHRLDYVLSDDDFYEIKQTVKIWFDQENKPMPEGVKCIESFTVLICGMLYSNIKGIEKFTKKTGISGYLCWLDEMMNKKNE